LISVIAGVISNLIMLPITMFISFKSFQHGWDPDNITSPIIAAFGDLFTLPAIIMSLFILQLLSVNWIIKDAALIVIFLILASIATIFIAGYRTAELKYTNQTIFSYYPESIND
jgi:mgtE-like transporter